MNKRHSHANGLTEDGQPFTICVSDGADQYSLVEGKRSLNAPIANCWWEKKRATSRSIVLTGKVSCSSDRTK